MHDSVDREQFTKGLCTPRDLVIEGLRSQDLFSAANALVANDPCSGVRTSEDIFQDLLKSLRDEDLKINCDRALLKSSCIKSRNDQPLSSLPASLSGISGFNTLLYAEEHLIRTGEISPHEVNLPCLATQRFEYRAKLCGKIRDYVYLHETKSGHLVVELIHEQFTTRQAFLDCKPDRVTLYHWDIDIDGCFQVHERCDGGFPDNPFPTLEGVDFPAHSLDPNDERSIWFRCLDHKLYAKGECIKVRHIYRQINDGKFLRLDETAFAHLYRSTEMSCVDLMFKGFPPAAQLPTQADYCLGRCAHPPIINSGGK